MLQKPVHQRQHFRGLKSIFGSSVQPRSPVAMLLWLHIKVLEWGRTVLEVVALLLYSATGKIWRVEMFGLYFKKKQQCFTGFT